MCVFSCCFLLPAVKAKKLGKHVFTPHYQTNKVQMWITKPLELDGVSHIPPDHEIPQTMENCGQVCSNPQDYFEWKRPAKQLATDRWS